MMAGYCEECNVEKVLVVEGMDDCHVFYHFCCKKGVPVEFGLCQKGGKENAIRHANALLMGSSRPAKIGLVLDADEEGAYHRWEQIRGRLERHGYDFSEGPQLGGRLLKGPSDYPDLGVWIMPDNSNNGILEDFLMGFSDNEGIEFARECVESATRNGYGNLKDVHFSKAIIHTYLAWQDEPGEALGRAVSKNILEADTSNGDSLGEWVRELFS